MRLLVSICNKHRGGDLEHPDGFIYEIDPDCPGTAPEPVFLRDARIHRANGVTGLTRYGGGILVVTQADIPQLAWLDPAYRVLDVWDLPLAPDAHSVAAAADEFHIASTGNDSIVILNPESGQRFYWRHNVKDRDTIHLNSIALFQGEWYATAFGRKQGKYWRTAVDGFLMNLSRNRMEMNGLYHPHTLVPHGDNLFYCESFRASVVDIAGRRLKTNRGYIRGMAISGAELFLGASTGRTYSRSTGDHVPRDDDVDLSVFPCEVLAYEWQKGDLASCRLKWSISLARYGLEIYDILVVP